MGKWKKGFTLVEMLCSVLVLLLVSMGMATGARIAMEHFASSVSNSEAQVLCQTITTVVSDELRYSGTVDWEKNPIRFFSQNYGGEDCSFGQNGDGQVTLGKMNLLPGKSYPYHMQAKVQVEGFQEEMRFRVTVTVMNSGGKILAENCFDVEKLNGK